MQNQKPAAARNRTLRISESDANRLRQRLRSPSSADEHSRWNDATYFGDAFTILPLIPEQSVDLLVADPPYNMDKIFGSTRHHRQSSDEYERWLNIWLDLVIPLLKPHASIYVCSEWRSSGIMQKVLESKVTVRNRITWEREKGRGALRNWKNCSEDIWFATVGDSFTFDVEAVKQKRRVVAPYRNHEGAPKDWREEEGGNFRLTFPSNIWTDISVPFWSMPENTDHPTQKPEKLIAKLVLASSKPGDLVLDPFVGSGTTSVVSKKLGRQYIGIEQEEQYCILAERRLEIADTDCSIQGYSNGCFWDRNTAALQDASGRVKPSNQKKVAKQS